MDSFNWVEWLGYLASIVVLISLLMSSLVKLRWINLIGATLFSIYGVIIKAPPVAIVNAFIALIDIYYLYLHYTSKERFDTVRANPNSELFNYLIESYKKEIKKIIDIDELKRCNELFYLMRNSEIAGIWAIKREGKKAEVLLDFVSPKYRDYKLGNYLYNLHPDLFKELNIEYLYMKPLDDSYNNYLKRMGFSKNSQSGVWERYL